MSLIVSGKKHYEPAPEGMFDAVCVDVVDLGMVKDNFGERRKCRIVWELSCKMPDGRPWTTSKQFNLTLHEKSTLNKFLKQWRGQAFTAEELKGFDLDKLIGAPARIVVTHQENDGMIYGNVTAVMKADPKSRLLPTGTFIRKQDRISDAPLPSEAYVSEMGAPEDVPEETPF